MQTTPLLTGQRPGDIRRLTRPVNLVAAVSIVVSLVVGLRVEPSTLWGFLPIALYGILAALGMRILVATSVSVLSAALLLLPGPQTVVEIARESAVDQVTIIGVVILLGGALAEILRASGAATRIVSAAIRVVGTSNTTSVAAGIMLTCFLLVAALGTLAGALAVAVPVLLPVAARAGLTRSATASAIFIGGCAGFAIAPFAGGNIAIMQAADTGYLGYLLHGGGPLAVLSIVVGMIVVPWMQRRTAGGDDHYSPEELGAIETDSPAVDDRRSGRAAVAFAMTLVAVLVVATITTAGIALPLLALPLLSIVTAAGAGMSPKAFAVNAYRGAAKLAWLFVLFYLLALLFNAIARLNPFTVVLGSYGTEIRGLTPFLFAMTVALIGWVGVPGASAAQVVLLDKIFGELASIAGIGAGVWVVVLLFASKADTYGPLPNVNMLGVMGLCRSANVRNILITGWCVLLPAVAMYTLFIYVGTR
ncbi:permease [Williamsia phyllosphaerae]|uniref:Permease n=1 Tax=Williamsia phyllosphaerae TaxID=885042 RepID=A0ABQ1UML9_9NOCA|nr:permease [Williamsia phyllosphaerae]GGF20525.1 permease [Williamsia phyllosphaerae]